MTDTRKRQGPPQGPDYPLRAPGPGYAGPPHYSGPAAPQAPRVVGPRPAAPGPQAPAPAWAPGYPMPARYPGPPHYSGPPVRAYAPLAAPRGPAPVPVLTPLPAARSAGAQSGAKKARALWPWALAAGAALAGALTVGGVVGLRAGWLGTQGISRKLLVEQKLEPNPRSPVSVAVPGDRGKVLLPPGVVTKKSTLAVSAITGLATPPEAGVGNTLEVRLGDLTRFDEPVTIEIPYDPAKVLGRRGKRP